MNADGQRPSLTGRMPPPDATITIEVVTELLLEHEHQLADERMHLRTTARENTR
jgi:hypothetical protein